MKKNNAFRTWLDKKKLHYEDIARSLSIPHGTVVAWGTTARQPRLVFRRLIAGKYPDCPLAAQ